MARRMREPAGQQEAFSELETTVPPKNPAHDRQPGLKWKMFEALIGYVLYQGYQNVARVMPQQVVGRRGVGGGKYVADWVVEHRGEKVLVSVKWQSSNGSFDVKVDAEADHLSYVVANTDASRAVLVLGGGAFSRKVSNRWLDGAHRVKGVTVMGTDKFLDMAYGCEL